MTAKSRGAENYQPEIGYCSYLDKEYPDDGEHVIYACYARDWTVKTLSGAYKWLVATQDIDTLIMIDGGSDSLMRGDEHGLGDPIEDAVSVGAGASLRTLKYKFLLSIGLGADRFNGVSDYESLKAVAELTKMGGFKGCVSFEPDSKGFVFYQNLVKHIYEKQTFRSVLTSLILTSGKGDFGFVVPEDSGGRVREGSAFAWPLVSLVLSTSFFNTFQDGHDMGV